MNEFLERAYKQIIVSISELTNTEALAIDVTMDNSIGGLYRIKLKDKTNKDIVILTISSEIEMSDNIAEIIYSLTDKVKGENGRLIIIHRSGNSKQDNDIQAFLEEKIDIFHADYLRLGCKGSGLRVSIDGERNLGLRDMLKKYFANEIAFIAPTVGKQFVNLEIYKDSCCKCKREISVVSGIVFPKTQMPNWNNPYWQYYNTLIPIYSLPSEYAKQIKRVVATLKEKNTKITPLIFYQDIELEENDWTVMCPHCSTVINKYEPDDNRIDYLFDLNNRMNGNLRYHTLLIDADQELINLLGVGYEFNVPHVCFGGWIESKNVKS